MRVCHLFLIHETKLPSRNVLSDEIVLVDFKSSLHIYTRSNRLKMIGVKTPNLNNLTPNEREQSKDDDVTNIPLQVSSDINSLDSTNRRTLRSQWRRVPDSKTNNANTI